MISTRRLMNVSRTRQRELAAQFSWLHSVHENEKREDVQVLSVSVFDHWLSRDEACNLLENISDDEQERRNALLENFCAKVTGSTEVLSFFMRGRKKDKSIFREFKSKEILANYCKPNGGKFLKHRHFYVVLPEWRCAFYESWDDTYHFFFTSPGIEEVAVDWAAQSGVYLLSQAKR